MEMRTDSVSFDAVEQKADWLIHGIGFTGLASVTLYSMGTSEYEGTPLLVMLFILGIACVFLFFLVTGLSMLALSMGKIVIDREEVRLCIGKLPLKRISTGEIRTIAFAHASFGRRQNITSLPMLVLSTEESEKLADRGSKTILRRNSWRQHLRKLRFDPDSRKARTYVALCETIVAYLLPWKKGLLLGFTAQRAELLRKYLPGAEFLA